MTKKVCIFIDGENFRYAICDLFPEFDATDYLPKKARWSDWFDNLVNQVTRKTSFKTERVRTYWYVIEDIDFFPYKFPRVEYEADTLQRLLCKYPPYRAELEQLSDDTLYNRMREMVSDLRGRQHEMRKRFDGWTKIQNAISWTHDAVEFRRAGSISYDLFTNDFGKEKAVDVKLAVDMINLRDNYDIALLVSGDQDYAPAVQAVKDFGKKVVNVVFETRNGKILGGTWRSNQHTDWTLRVDHSELHGYLFPNDH
ncbi:MAG: NYN domain-containing protein [Desulfatibacillaceae bacterium]